MMPFLIHLYRIESYCVCYNFDNYAYTMQPFAHPEIYKIVINVVDILSAYRPLKCSSEFTALPLLQQYDSTLISLTFMNNYCI